MREKEKIIVGGIIGFLLQMILSNTIGEPIENFLFPPRPNITLRIMDQPIIKEDSYYARFFIVNTGKTSLTGLAAEYNFLCTINGSKRAFLEKTALETTGSETYFDVPFKEVGLDYNCSPTAPITLRFFADKKGKVYCASEEVTRTPCTFCHVNVTIISKEIPQILNYSVSYPFFVGQVTLSVGGEHCLPLEEIENRNLKEIPEKRITITALSIWENCARGEINLEWCKEHGYMGIE